MIESIFRCLLFIGRGVLRSLASAEHAVLHIIEHSLTPALTLGIRAMKSAPGLQSSSMPNFVNPVSLLVAIELIREACVQVS